MTIHRMAILRNLPGTIGTILLALSLGLAAESRAQDTNCYCRLALLSGSDPLTGGVEILPWESLHVYNTSPFEMADIQAKNCVSRCFERASQDPLFSDPAALCKKLARPFDGRRQAVARLEDDPPVSALFFPLKCCPVSAAPVSCPSGWTSDPKGPGTLKCRRNAGHLTADPLPPNGTPIGTWGVVLGADIWQWGPPAPPPPGTAAPVEVRPCP
ncbi:MAG TPA: hypothetical protein VF173_26500 [Thermoanaerobaculia bacterium]|nr:hypothetical protein [Thermoanaerobaculia bacterium]